MPQSTSRDSTPKPQSGSPAGDGEFKAQSFAFDSLESAEAAFKTHTYADSETMPKPTPKPKDSKTMFKLPPPPPSSRSRLAAATDLAQLSAPPPASTLTSKLKRLNTLLRSKKPQKHDDTTSASQGESDSIDKQTEATTVGDEDNLSVNFGETDAAFEGSDVTTTSEIEIKGDDEASCIGGSDTGSIRSSLSFRSLRESIKETFSSAGSKSESPTLEDSSFSSLACSLDSLEIVDEVDCNSDNTAAVLATTEVQEDAIIAQPQAEQMAELVYPKVSEDTEIMTSIVPLSCDNAQSGETDGFTKEEALESRGDETHGDIESAKMGPDDATHEEENAASMSGANSETAEIECLFESSNAVEIANSEQTQQHLECDNFVAVDEVQQPRSNQFDTDKLLLEFVHAIFNYNPETEDCNPTSTEQDDEIKRTDSTDFDDNSSRLGAVEIFDRWISNSTFANHAKDLASPFYVELGLEKHIESIKEEKVGLMATKLSKEIFIEQLPEFCPNLPAQCIQKAITNIRDNETKQTIVTNAETETDKTVIIQADEPAAEDPLADAENAFKIPTFSDIENGALPQAASNEELNKTEQVEPVQPSALTTSSTSSISTASSSKLFQNFFRGRSINSSKSSSKQSDGQIHDGAEPNEGTFSKLAGAPKDNVKRIHNIVSKIDLTKTLINDQGFMSYIGNIENENKKIEQKMHAYREEYIRAQSVYQMLKDKYKKKSSEYEEKKKELQTKDSKITSLTKELTVSKARNNELQANMKNLNTKYATLLDENEKYREQVDSLSMKNAVLHSFQQRLQSDVKQQKVYYDSKMDELKNEMEIITKSSSQELDFASKKIKAALFATDSVIDREGTAKSSTECGHKGQIKSYRCNGNDICKGSPIKSCCQDENSQDSGSLVTLCGENCSTDRLATTTAEAVAKILMKRDLCQRQPRCGRLLLRFFLKLAFWVLVILALYLGLLFAINEVYPNFEIDLKNGLEMNFFVRKLKHEAELSEESLYMPESVYKYDFSGPFAIVNWVLDFFVQPNPDNGRLY